MGCNCGKKSMNKWTKAQAETAAGRRSGIQSRTQNQQQTSPTATTQPSPTTGR